MNHENHPGPGRRGGGDPRWKITFAVFAAVALFFLLAEHRAHVFGFLPYLLVLACPLMHLFHHGGHGGHGRHGHAQREDEPPRPGRTNESRP